MPLQTPRAVLEAEVMRDHHEYMKCFEAADMEGIQKYCHFPLAYIGEGYVRKADKYPFDLKKLQAKTGFAKAEDKTTIIAVDDTKCHMLIEARRLKADGSLAQHNSAFYYLLKKEGIWKVAAFSGVLTDAKDVTPEEDEALKAKIAGKPFSAAPKSKRLQDLEQEVKEGHKGYGRAFGKGDMEEMKNHITNPIAYLGDDFLKIGPEYPFDLGKLLARVAGGKKAAPAPPPPSGEPKKKPRVPGEIKETIMAVDEKKAHILIEGRRCQPDGTLTEQNRAFYILLKDQGHWKTACFSGVLTKKADVSDEEDAAFKAYLLDKSQFPPQPRAKL